MAFWLGFHACTWITLSFLSLSFLSPFFSVDITDLPLYGRHGYTGLSFSSSRVGNDVVQLMFAAVDHGELFS